jgi:predicted amidohydrolase
LARALCRDHPLNALHEQKSENPGRAAQSCGGGHQWEPELAREAYAEAKDKGADLLVLSELFILGYPAEDLVLKPAAVEDSMKAVQALAAETAGGPAVIIGSPWMDGKKRHNSAVLLKDGAVAGRYDKRELPNYGVFDEKRIFDAGRRPPARVRAEWHESRHRDL